MRRGFFRNHRNPWNLVLHGIGIPLVVGAIFLFAHDWRWAIAMLLSGIFIQEIGHSFERE